MEGQDHQTYGSSPEVIAALLELTRLSQQALSARGSVAIKLLARLAMLCQVQRGAILLPMPDLPLPGASLATSLSLRKMFRPLTLLGMDEEEALVLASSFLREGSAIQIPLDEPCRIIARLSLSASFAPEQDGFSSETPLTTIPNCAVLVLAGAKEARHSWKISLEKASAILPLVADAAGSVILTMLLAEHVHELEVTTDRKALREMELLKAELLGTVSHELRSPLASIKGYAATLLRHERRISREERHEFLLAINEASDRLDGVINRLLVLSQLETGSISIERAPVNLLHLAREAVMALEQRLADPLRQDRLAHLQEHFTFAIRVEDGQEHTHAPVIQADRLRLREVLDNLLENAANYSPDGGAIDVVIRSLSEQFRAGEAWNLADDGQNEEGVSEDLPALRLGQPMIEICVHDQGIGIPTEQLRLIFDRFHRVDTRLTREVNGLGLGLAICKRIVELHDGMIWAESELGRGSTFHVWLPMQTNE